MFVSNNPQRLQKNLGLRPTICLNVTAPKLNITKEDPMALKEFKTRPVQGHSHSGWTREAMVVLGKQDHINKVQDLLTQRDT